MYKIYFLIGTNDVQNTITHNVTVFIVIVNNNLIQYKSNCMNCGQKPMARLGIFEVIVSGTSFFVCYCCGTGSFERGWYVQVGGSMLVEFDR